MSISSLNYERRLSRNSMIETSRNSHENVNFSKLHLLNEPFSAVDMVTRLRLQKLIVNVIRERGISAIMVTHDGDKPVLLSDRVLVMNMGPANIIRCYEVSPLNLEDRNSRAFLN